MYFTFPCLVKWIFFIYSSLRGFVILVFSCHPATRLNLILMCRILLLEFFGCYKEITMSSRDSCHQQIMIISLFLLIFSLCYLFLLYIFLPFFVLTFSCWITLAEYGFLCLATDFRRRVFILWPLWLILGVACHT